MPLYVPTYPPDGGPAIQFVCLLPAKEGEPKACRKGTKTEAGMKVHLFRCHGIKLQLNMFEPNAPAQAVAAPLTAEEPAPKPKKRRGRPTTNSS